MRCTLSSELCIRRIKARVPTLDNNNYVIRHNNSSAKSIPLQFFALKQFLESRYTPGEKSLPSLSQQNPTFLEPWELMIPTMPKEIMFFQPCHTQSRGKNVSWACGLLIGSRTTRCTPDCETSQTTIAGALAAFVVAVVLVKVL